MCSKWASPAERYSTVAWLDHLLLVRTSVTINEVYSLKCLLEFRARIRLFHNFCTIIKERADETRRTKYRRMISQFGRDQLLFIDESAKRWQDFSGKYQYNQLCKREGILRNTCCGRWPTQNPLRLKDRQEKFCRRAIYGMIDGSQNTIFSWWKVPNGRVKLKTVVRTFEAEILKIFKNIQSQPKNQTFL